MTTQSHAGRVPPHNLDAEGAVLSAAILASNCLDEVASTLRPIDFFSDANATIYAVILELYTAGRPIDTVAITDVLRGRQQLDGVGGPSYLARIVDETPAVAHVGEHARIIVDRAVQREMLSRLWECIGEGYGEVRDVREWADRVEATIHAVANSKAAAADAESMRDVLVRVFRELQSPSPDPGVTTGLTDLDRILGPMRPGQLIVVGAHSGVGKTSLGMQMALNAARSTVRLHDSESHQGVFVVSEEMTKEELALRALFSAAQVDGQKAANPAALLDRDWGALAEAAPKVALDNVWFDDRAGLSTFHIRSMARRTAARSKKKGWPLRLILIDYIQLLDGGGSAKHERRDLEIAAISKGLKHLAKELWLPIVVLAQLNDDSVKERRPPRKEDLRECKAVAQDADKVILIHNTRAAVRSHVQLDDGGVFPAEDVDIIVDKNRGGRMGKALTWFYPTYTAFTDMTLEDQRRIWEERRDAREERRAQRGRRA
jgi:replicative DNA helicase